MGGEEQDYNTSNSEVLKENIKQTTKEAAKQGIKHLWKTLPPNIKLYIICGGVALFVIFCGIAIVLGATETNYLDYAMAVPENGVVSAYEEYWADLCKDGDTNCSEEQIKAAKELLESQTAFYDKFEALSKKYGLSNEQKYIILTTTFFNYNIDDFTAGNGAFILDDTDEIDYTVPEDINVYDKEVDTLKELIKQFKIETVSCTYTNPGTGEATTYALEDLNKNTYTLNFFEKVLYYLGLNPKDDNFLNAVSFCNNNQNGVIIFETYMNSDLSIQAYYNYLRDSTYLDDRENLSSYYRDYADWHNISPDKSTWTEEELIEVREKIIKNIQMIVEDYMEENSLGVEFSSGSQYWFPIGSKETTEENGIIFASGEPEYMSVTSPFGSRIHPVTGRVTDHDGVDLGGGGNYNVNIIASLGGTVMNLYNECDSYNSPDCGGGYGNYIEIMDVKGNITFYAHMFKDAFTVSVGDSVAQGQKIGEMGNSGRSTGPHLHFEIKINGLNVDPMEYISIENPRPASYGDLDFHTTPYSREEFVAILKNYYSDENVCKSDKSQYVNGCNSFKNEIINNDGAEKIYDIGTSKGLNPELVVARSVIEGYSPGTNYNYFGYSCYNDGGLAACSTFVSFSSAMEAFFNNISQYDSLEAMMSRYAYIGDYWYTGTHWSWGGCAYAEYIYPDAMPDRVRNACAHEDGYCSLSNTSNCEPTTAEDQAAYARWQVSKMDQVRDKIFE